MEIDTGLRGIDLDIAQIIEFFVHKLRLDVQRGEDPALPVHAAAAVVAEASAAPAVNELVNLRVCPRNHRCEVRTAKRQYTCNACGQKVYRKARYAHCFTCVPTYVMCCNCQDSQGTAESFQYRTCTALCGICNDRQCTWQAGHSEPHRCSNFWECREPNSSVATPQDAQQPQLSEEG